MTLKTNRLLTAVLAIMLQPLLMAQIAVAGTTLDVSTSAEFSQALATAGRGDEIVLAPGDYKTDQSFIAIDLTDVLIRSADPDNLAVIRSTGNEGLTLRSPERVTVDGLIIDGALFNGLNMDDHDQYATNPGRDVTLRNVIVRNVGSNGNHDGIKIAGVIGFHLDRVQVIGWGEAGSAVDIVGGHYGLIENSYFRNSATQAGSGVRPKGGSTNITIRANRFESAGERPIQFGGSSTEAYFRPQPASNFEARFIVAEGNVIIGSPTGVAFVNNISDSSFHHNFIYRPTKWVRRLLHETSRVPLSLQQAAFADNVIVWQEGDIVKFVNQSPNTKLDQFTFTRNTWFNETAPASSTPAASAGETGAIVGRDPKLDTEEPIVWEFDWGLWLVNATPNANSKTMAEIDGLRMATPANDQAKFDPRQRNPLIGAWTLQTLNTTTLPMDSHSQIILISGNLPAASAASSGTDMSRTNGGGSYSLYELLLLLAACSLAIGSGRARRI